MPAIPSTSSAYRGRFAPSPTGPLHFGSLVAAVGSYLEAKHHDGEWLVRIEDLDTPRTVSGASSSILNVLEKLGMEWDGVVVYQSQRNKIYQNALASLERQGLIYSCQCSRKEIADSSIRGIGGLIYPGTCRNHSYALEQSSASRIQTTNDPISFKDRLQGLICQRLNSDIGDFVLRRADGIYAYQLAVVVDDAEQQITHVVRGSDLLGSTPRQIYLQQLLNYITPVYMHLPLVMSQTGEKLSKQTYAAPIDLINALSQLVAAARFLGQEPPIELLKSDVSSFWQWAIKNWQSHKIPPSSLR
ncbi:glutamyl-Q tRNA(Asp) synthetase [Nitrosomonas cryotolerans]|uniref:Glutamyl-Q tRNA(Asp) synthetase n=1 Tax=Nitrosomonas cryotolerans ATCC 49181 TaxID=1131553 RepID=A0A1N6IQB1_9PROT|nr:tRNA glutamyl-Q(34) synthetase GluQRS [Nitrosomonas cryotolerans]SFP34668.1 glutamyl-Q tRNA(Asp) synthetase [Nitrosomonas cryotolerans]SIO34188.1 glutamyl-Q tRNA(Asp) synthetase [Nitrosomonas cryotolerans ATCC 49181]